MCWALQKTRSHYAGREDPESYILLYEKLLFGEEGNVLHEQPVNTPFRTSEKIAKSWKNPLFRARKKKPSHAIKMLWHIETLSLRIKKCIPSVLLLPFK